MAAAFDRIKKWMRWDRITSQKALSKIVIILLAALFGAGVFLFIDHQAHNGPEEYYVISPSKVLSSMITTESEIVSVDVLSCSTFDRNVYVAFDTVWLHYPDSGDGIQNSEPALNGFSSGAVIEPGGMGCDQNVVNGVPFPVPLGDPALTEQGQDAGGMWAGLWSMDSNLIVSECDEFVENPDSLSGSGYDCAVIGERIHHEEWNSDIFEIVEPPPLAEG